jgi:hypothetical protein
MTGNINEEGASEEQQRVFFLFVPSHLLRLFYGAHLFGLTFVLLFPYYSVPVACWRKCIPDVCSCNAPLSVSTDEKYPDKWCIQSLVRSRR